MAFLPRIFRNNTIKQCLSFTRNLMQNTSQISHVKVPKILVNTVNNSWIYQQNDRIQSPVISPLRIDLPNGLKYVPPLEDPKPDKEIELPTIIEQEPIEAARMIVIRRNKMKRHKLKKLRKRMKFEWAKRRQRREWNKEKLFQAELIKQCKEGEAFSAEKYVEERLSKLNALLSEKENLNKKKRV